MNLPRSTFSGFVFITSAAVLAACDGANTAANSFVDCSFQISPPGNYSFSESTGRVVPADGGTADGAEALQNCVDAGGL